MDQIGVQFAQNPTLFSKWSYDDLEVKDVTLVNYMNVFTSKGKVFMPHTAGRYQTQKFKKTLMPLIERVMGALQFHGRNTGKKLKAMRIMKQCLEIIHLQTGENPVQIVIDAITNSGPREDSTRIGKGGNVKRVAVDVSSFRRVW